MYVYEPNTCLGATSCAHLVSDALYGLVASTINLLWKDENRRIALDRSLNVPYRKQALAMRCISDEDLCSPK
jgi:hypothetical protein